jgi:hypothetical protein
MAFIAYHPKQGIKESVKMIISLSKASIVLNRLSREALKTPEYVALAFDPDDNILKITPSNKEEGILVKKTKIFAKGFYNFFDLHINGRYIAIFNQEDESLCATLNPDNKG